MDEFSWFVGLYEGEGSLYVRKGHKTVKGKRYEFVNLALTIKMVDEDVIARAAKFLNISYHPTDQKYLREHPERKPLFRVVKVGSVDGGLRELLNKMYPHLSKRRQRQIDEKLQKGEAIKKEVRRPPSETQECAKIT